MLITRRLVWHHDDLGHREEQDAACCQRRDLYPYFHSSKLHLQSF